MADDRDARIAELEAQLRRRDAELEQRDRALAEALGREAAMAAISRAVAVVSADAQPVLEEVIRHAARLSDSTIAAITLLDRDHLRLVAGLNAPMEVGTTLPLSERRPNTRALIERRTIHIPDLADPVMLAGFPDGTYGYGSALATVHVPLLRDAEAVGVLVVGRVVARAYSEREIALLETFADQVVIAIENARLFQKLEQRNAELQESNRQVNEALEQQTATAEVLRVIAASPTDLRGVLYAVIQAAVRLCPATSADIWRVDGDD